MDLPVGKNDWLNNNISRNTRDIDKLESRLHRIEKTLIRLGRKLGMENEVVSILIDEESLENLMNDDLINILADDEDDDDEDDPYYVD